MLTRIIRISLLFLCCASVSRAAGTDDTVIVMSYNVLDYGTVCQGSRSVMHNYLSTIIAHTRPDILGLVKAASVKMAPSDIYGLAPYGFLDSVTDLALNTAIPGRYAYAPVSNTAYADDVSMLFYNKEKFGFLKMDVLGNYITDFPLYKLYYKDPLLSTTHDTTFLYIVLNHTKSGDDASRRGSQIETEMNSLKDRFSHLPNLINMGDFNTRSSVERGYQLLTMTGVNGFLFKDPPFGIDSVLTYPAPWRQNPTAYAAYLTTSTRRLSNQPNTCGTDGGAKSWYDHILFSPWLVEGTNYMKYLPGSYTTVGNDGQRVGISINEHTPRSNNAAPAAVLEALYQFSNKYPVLAKMVVSSNIAGTSLPDPDKTTLSIGRLNDRPAISIANPVTDRLQVFLQSIPSGTDLNIRCFDLSGRLVMEQMITPGADKLSLPFNVESGVYFVQISSNGQPVFQGKVMKED